MRTSSAAGANVVAVVAVVVVMVMVAGAWSADVHVLNVAHRGYSSAAPENTMEALRAAAEAGADGVEIDVQVTKDEVVVLLHDSTLNRTTNCSGPISDYNYKPESGGRQLSECDAGSWFGPQFAGARVPSLSEALAYTVEAGLFMVIDMKQTGGGIGELLAGVMPDPRVQATTVASCWTAQQRDEVLGSLNATRVQLLTSDLSPWRNDPAGFFAELALERVDGFSVIGTEVDPAFVRDAHAHFMAVAVWTINDGPDMRAAINGGVDAILTDYVTRLGQTIRAVEAPPPDPLSSGYTRNSTVTLIGIFSFLTGAFAVLVIAAVARSISSRRARASRNAHRGVTSPTSFERIP